MKLRALAKEAVYGTFLASGVSAFGRRRRRGGLIILTHHSFGDIRDYPYLGRLPVVSLERQLDHLQAHYEIVALEEGLRRLATGEFSARPMVAITVDDGYFDNRSLFFPIMRNRSLPASIFVATDYLDTGRLPWPTRINAALHYATHRTIVHPIKLDLANPAANRILKQYLARLGTQEREGVLEAIEAALAPVNVREIPPLTWDAVREMSAAGMTIGSHTACHGWLDGLSYADIEDELTHSRTRIETETGIPCRFIAYPNGNWSQTVIELSRKTGYHYGLSQDCGVNFTSNLQPFSLKRIEVPYNERIGSFACRITGMVL